MSRSPQQVAGGIHPPSDVIRTAQVLRPTRALDGVASAFAGPHPHNSLGRDHPDLAVPDLAGGGRADDGVDNVVGLSIIHEDLEADLGHEVDLVLSPSVHLGVTTLTTETLGL